MKALTLILKNYYNVINSLKSQQLFIDYLTVLITNTVLSNTEINRTESFLLS